jgi:thymidylate synthase (FAD)
VPLLKRRINLKRVKLISITRPVGEIEHLSPEELTAYVARVSNPSNQMNTETASKLLGFCIRNNHWSVFEHVSFTVEIKTSRAISAQILRHRSACFQEFSQRYAEITENEFYPARSQDLKNRQNSKDDMSDADKNWFDIAQKIVWNYASGMYKEALKKGIAKEQARFLLPLSTQTTIYMTNNVRNWIHYIDLRTKNGTQLEHKEIAEEIKIIFKNEFPEIAKAKEW